MRGGERWRWLLWASSIGGTEVTWLPVIVSCLSSINDQLQCSALSTQPCCPLQSSPTPSALTMAASSRPFFDHKFLWSYHHIPSFPRCKPQHQPPCFPQLTNILANWSVHQTFQWAIQSALPCYCRECSLPRDKLQHQYSGLHPPLVSHNPLSIYVLIKVKLYYRTCSPFFP